MRNSKGSKRILPWKAGWGRATIWFVLVLSALTLHRSALAADAAPDEAREILTRADRIRFPTEGFQVEVTITSAAPDADPEVRAYRILSKGNNLTIVLTTAPEIDRNQMLLMRDHDLWAYLPNLTQPLRLPLSQRLTGQVANGDLARANFSGDYDPKILRQEKIENDTFHVLELEAIDQWVTYRRVLLWVNVKNDRPLKAEFYAVSGRLLKTCHYAGFHPMGGATRPTRLIIEDALRNGYRSTLEYSAMKLRDLPDKIFSKDYLKRLGS